MFLVFQSISYTFIPLTNICVVKFNHLSDDIFILSSPYFQYLKENSKKKKFSLISQHL